MVKKSTKQTDILSHDSNQHPSKTFTNKEYIIRNFFFSIKNSYLFFLSAIVLIVIGFSLFLSLQDSFTISVETELQYVLTEVVKSEEVVPLWPSVFTILKSLLMYVFFLFFILIITQFPLFSILLAKKTDIVPSFLKENTFCYYVKNPLKMPFPLLILFAFSILCTFLILLILSSLPLITTTIISFIVVFSILYSLSIVFSFIGHNSEKFFSFLFSFMKITLYSAILFIFFLFLHFLISVFLLRSLGFSPLDSTFFYMVLLILKILFHAIAIQFIVYSYSLITKSFAEMYRPSSTRRTSTNFSIKELLRYCFMRKKSYIHSLVFIIYLVCIIFIAQLLLYITELLSIENVGVFLNFIFLLIFLQLGIAYLYYLEVNDED